MSTDISFALHTWCQVGLHHIAGTHTLQPIHIMGTLTQCVCLGGCVPTGSLLTLHRSSNVQGLGVKNFKLG